LLTVAKSSQLLWNYCVVEAGVTVFIFLS